ncbi:MAG: endo alpha-1,4 polygalactosaminidase [Rhodospirillales bacterium]|jgi:cysteinyl-tRNA synthetase|nr:endo alpha-1,4 polygalactosaminidase [Rhodospirillales bacterium]
MLRRCRVVLLSAFVALLGAAPSVFAQTQPPSNVAPMPQLSAGTPLQGAEVMPAADAPTAVPAGNFLDYREEMRKLVQAIATYARGQNRDFAVVPMGGLNLLVKRDPAQTDQVLPAPAYARAIGGVLVEGLHYGVPVAGKPTEADRRERLLPLIERARMSGLPVLGVDYVTDPKTIDDARAQAARRGVVFFAAPARGLGLNALPKYPRRPFAENGDNVLGLREVRNFVMLRDSAPFGREDAFAMKMHDTNYDLVIVDVFHKVGQPLSKRAVETLKYKKLGARRLVFAYANIAAAASDAFYWKANWREGTPTWISAPTPGNPDQYFVEYWQPEWQQIVFGGPQSYLYGIIAQGFDGVILDGVDNYLFYEGGLDAVAAAER